MDKPFEGIFSKNMSVRDRWTIESELRKKKYQIYIKLRSGKIRYLYIDSPDAAELYVTVIAGKILKIIKQ